MPHREPRSYFGASSRQLLSCRTTTKAGPALTFERSIGFVSRDSNLLQVIIRCELSLPRCRYSQPRYVTRPRVDGLPRYPEFSFSLLPTKRASRNKHVVALNRIRRMMKRGGCPTICMQRSESVAPTIFFFFLSRDIRN